MRKNKSNTTFCIKLYCFYSSHFSCPLLFQIYIQLVKRNLDSVFIKGCLYLLHQIPPDGPVVLCLHPAADLQIHRAVRQVVYYNHVILILQDGGLRGQQIQADFFGQLQIRRVADAHSNVDTALVLSGHVDQTAVRQGAVGDHDLFIVNREQGRVEHLNLGHLALQVPGGVDDIIAHLKWLDQQNQHAARRNAQIGVGQKFFVELGRGVEQLTEKYAQRSDCKPPCSKPCIRPCT